MAATAHLDLPYIAASQAQKHVTHNEAIRDLDLLVMIAILELYRQNPPATPEDGDRYIIGENATGPWQGHDYQLAAWIDGAWRFFAPRRGWQVFNLADDRLYMLDSNFSWEPIVTIPDQGAEIQNAALFGLATTADAENPFSAKLNSALWTASYRENSGTGDLRYVMNKQADSDTLSLLMQTNWSGRAEIGLAGNDDLTMKVSQDGSVWNEALVIDHATGKVEFKNNLIPESPVVSIMADGGRFAGSPEPAGTTVSTFAVPPWAALANGATLSAHAKFITNSTTYGGTGAAVDSDIQQLMEMLVESTHRRFYPEFFVASLVAGAGTASALTFPDAVTRYSQLYTQSFGRPVKLTLSFYVKVMAGDAGIPFDITRRLFVDGIEMFARRTVPADGDWHHVLVMEGEDFARHWRYSYDAIRLYQREGDEALIAFPAAVPGQILLPQNVGQIPGTARW